MPSPDASGSVAVMFLDLDDFKTVNDAYGHAAGDKVLRAVADALRGAVRAEDTVARLGGDEFAVLLDDSPDRYEAALVAGRLLGAVQVPVHLAGYQHAIGVSHWDQPGQWARRFGRDPDARRGHRHVRGQGAGQGHVHRLRADRAPRRGPRPGAAHRPRPRDPPARVRAPLPADPVAGNRRTLPASRPWSDGAIRTWACCAPAEFISLAEATGAIIPLGEWILEEACRAAATWTAAAPIGDGAAPAKAPGYVSVNLSAVQLADPGFAATLGRILRGSGLSPHQLVLEVTESARLDQDVAAGTLRRVRAAGVRLAIDDFGTGYAALGQLARMPFDLVKIERSFVTTIGTDPRAESLVAGIVDLARRLGVEVVAEGIEDGVQLARLRGAGCAFGQGFHFAAPMPSAELATFLADHAADPTAAAPATRRRPAPTPRAT